MSTPVIPVPGTPAPEAPKPFDAKAHIAGRNAADQLARSGVRPEPPKPAAAAPAAAPAPAGDGEENVTLEQHSPRLPKSVRREITKLREDNARYQGRLSAFEELGIKPKPAETPAAPVVDDPQPERDKFASDGEYERAMGRWEARQEAVKVIDKRDEAGRTEAELEQLKTTMKAMDTKAAADSKLFPDWAEVAQKAEDDGTLVVDWSKHQNLYMRLGLSDVKAAMLYHWATNPEVLQELLTLSPDLVAQDRMFSRLEGKIEKLYTAKEPKNETPAAPAGGAPAPAAAPETRVATPAERDAGKPRPSSEVSAPRGGAPAAEEPAPGTAAWMAKKNQEQFHR